MANGKTKNPSKTIGILIIAAGFIVAFILMLGVFVINAVQWNKAAKTVLRSDVYRFEEDSREYKIAKALMEERDKRRNEGEEPLTFNMDWKNDKYTGSGPTWVRTYAMMRAVFSTVFNFWIILYLLPIIGGIVIGAAVMLIGGKSPGNKKIQYPQS